jgi:hypothetical protein
MVATPEKLNFLYRFETPSAVYTFTDVAEEQDYNGETYQLIQIDHTQPEFSEDPSDAEIDIMIHESNDVANLWVLGPPAYPIKITIYEYNRTAGTVDTYYKGWVVRPRFNLQQSIVSFHCKTVWLFYERESFTDSLSPLSRYSIFDPRSGVDIEGYKVTITVSEMNDERDQLTVTGITEPDDWFKGGIIVAPDQDVRTILTHETNLDGDKVLTLNAAFPQFTLAVGFSADIYPGDDLTYATWANKFGVDTNNGEAHGGWSHMPNVDPSVRGVF